MIRVRVLAVSLTLATVSHSPVQAQLPSGSTQMVEVLGSATRVMTLGLQERESGEPVLVLQAGAGSRMETWGALIPRISELAPLVAYDRPGIGGSPFDGIDPTPDRVTRHLHALLNVLNVSPPYILVGHSRGGILILYYAGRYPEEVVGMVYVDPPDPNFTREDYWRLAHDEGERAAMRAELDALDAREPSGSAGRQAETRIMRERRDTPVEDRAIPALPRVPTAIVLATRYQDFGVQFMDPQFQEAMHQQRIDRFLEWTQRLPKATLIIATDAGHFVHRSDPELVAEAVRRVVAVGSHRRVSRVPAPAPPDRRRSSTLSQGGIP